MSLITDIALLRLLLGVGDPDSPLGGVGDVESVGETVGTGAGNRIGSGQRVGSGQRIASGQRRRGGRVSAIGGGGGRVGGGRVERRNESTGVEGGVKRDGERAGGVRNRLALVGTKEDSPRVLELFLLDVDELLPHLFFVSLLARSWTRESHTRADLSRCGLPGTAFW